MFALRIILTIIVVSGLIALIGDRVGHYIGRKRLTLFNMRPRRTAIAITVITGSLIALFTVGILFTVSADVRTAFFGLDNLKRMIAERSKELEQIRTDRNEMLSEMTAMQKTLEESKREISVLQTAKASLSKEIRTARSGDLVFKVNDVLTSTVIENSKDRGAIIKKLGAVLSGSDNALRKIVGNSKKHYIVMPEDELNEAADYIIGNPGSTVVRVVAARNVVLGEDVPVHFELFANTRVFKKGDVLASSAVNGRTAPEIEQKIKELLSGVNDAAIEKGVLPGPDGSVGSVPYSKIFELARTIKSRTRSSTILVECTGDVFTAGPLSIDIRIKE